MAYNTDALDEESRQLLVASVNESLSSIGEKFKEAIIRHVTRRTGLTLNDVVDRYRDFMAPVIEILGKGAVHVLEVDMARRFYNKLGLVFVETGGHGLGGYLEGEEKQVLERRAKD